MFTGIIADVGKLVGISRESAGVRITLSTSLDTGDFELGESIAVNGVCLTVDKVLKGAFDADASPETLRRSNLGKLHAGDPVNLERALRPVDRLGGHFVMGHVDGVGQLLGRRREGEFETLRFSAPPEVARYLVEKGSVAVDGISLTIAEVTENGFTVALIPHTLGRTTLGTRKPGDSINLEADILGKYVEKLIKGGKPSGGLTMEMLAQGGFIR